MASLEEEGELTGGGPTRHLDHHVVVGWTCSVAVVATFVASTATRNYSQVDKLWSIMPVIYAWQLAVDRRTAVMAALVTIWGARLTYNFARRGGYAWWPPWRGGEDYRWAYIADGKFCKFLHARANPLLWHTFKFRFYKPVPESPAFAPYRAVDRRKAPPRQYQGEFDNNDGLTSGFI